MNPNSSAVSAQTSSPLGQHHGVSHEINKFYMSSLLNLNQEGMAIPEHTTGAFLFSKSQLNERSVWPKDSNFWSRD